MATPGAPIYVDADELLVAALAAEFPGVRVCTELPADVEQVLPCVQVNRFGGNAETPGVDRVYCDYDVWHSSDQACALLAGQVRSWLLMGLAGTRIVAPTGTGVVLRVHEQTGAMRRPSGNADTWRRGGVLTIYVQAAP